MKQPNYVIRLLQVAEEDFNEIITYIALDNSSAAEAVAGKIENSLSNLSSYPLIVLARYPMKKNWTVWGIAFSLFKTTLFFTPLKATLFGFIV